MFYTFSPQYTKVITRLRNTIRGINGSSYNGTIRRVIWFEPCLCTTSQGNGVAPAVGAPIKILLDRGQELSTGSELAPAITAVNWSGTNWSVAGGVATHTSGSTAALASTLGETTASGYTYTVQFTVTGSSTVNVVLDAITTTTGYGAGSHSILIQATVASTTLSIIPASDFSGTISSISVKRISGNHGSATDVNGDGDTYPWLALNTTLGSYYVNNEGYTDDFFSINSPYTPVYDLQHSFIGANLREAPSVNRVLMGDASSSTTRFIRTTTGLSYNVASGGAKTISKTLSPQTLIVAHGFTDSTNVNMFINGEVITPVALAGALTKSPLNRFMGGFDVGTAGVPNTSGRTQQYINIFIDGDLREGEITAIRNYIKIITGASY